MPDGEVSAIALPGTFHSSRLTGVAGRAPAALLLGDENRLAAQVARQVRSGPGLPATVHIYGAAGTGKSCLLASIVALAAQRHGWRAALLHEAAAFSREWSKAVRQRATSELRYRFQSLRLLAIDDIDQLAESTVAQQELTQLIDGFAETGGLLAVTSTAPPEALYGFDARLLSRMAGGLVVPLVEHGPAARQAILNAIRDRVGSSWTDQEISQLVAQPRGGPAQWLEMLRALPAVLMPKSLTRGVPVSIAQVALRVAAAYRLRIADLKGSCRQRTVAEARAMAMFLARELSQATHIAIGRYFGGRDPSTVRHNCLRIAELTRRSRDVRLQVVNLRTSLSTGSTVVPNGENLSSRRSRNRSQGPVAQSRALLRRQYAHFVDSDPTTR